MTSLTKILRSSLKVFSFSEASIILQISDRYKLANILNYYVRTKQIYQLRRGIYSLSESFDKFSLANRIYTPSYISFESVLFKEGVIFQYYSDTYLASYLSRAIQVLGHSICYKKLKDSILLNLSGIENQNGYYSATKERALLDMLYITDNDYYFDNLADIDWGQVEELASLYESKKLEKAILKLKGHATQ
jgi:hypothetical protein